MKTTLIAALAIFLTGVFPPWKVTYIVRSDNAAAPVSTAIAYDWLFREKALPGYDVLNGVAKGVGYSVDYGRLLIEWAIIAAFYRAAVQLLPGRRAKGGDRADQ